MKLALNNLNLRVVEATDVELAWLDEYTSCTVKEYRGRGAGSRVVEGRFRLYDSMARELPAGFYSQLVKSAPTAGVELIVHDERTAPCFYDPNADLGWLRDYQRNAIEMAVRRGGRGLVKSPTASGKTEIAFGFTRYLPCEWLFVCHRSDIIAQTARRYEARTGERAGIYMEGQWKRGTSNFNVSTFQALYAGIKKGYPPALDLLEKAEGLLVDESHAQPADSFYTVSMAMKNAYYRIGLSGTPLDRSTKDSLRAIGALGPVVFKISTQLLIDRGVLSKPKIRMKRCRQEGVSNRDEGFAKAWRGVYRDLVVRSADRNRALVECALSAKKPCMLFVDEKAQGELLEDMLKHAGLKVDFAHGDHWLAKRQEKIQQLVDGEVDVLLCTVIFQEGIDVPELKSVVNGAGKASTVAALQRMGRGMRVEKDKHGNVVFGGDEFELWDILDDGQRWLARHAQERKYAYEKEGHEVEVVP